MDQYYHTFAFVLSFLMAPIGFVLMTIWFEYFSPNKNRYINELRKQESYRVLEKQFRSEHAGDQSMKRFQSSDFVGKLCILGSKSAWSLCSVTLVKYKRAHYFLTAKHAFKKAYNPAKESPKDLTVIILLGGKRFECRGSDFFIDPHHDLAITKAPKGFHTELSLPDNSLPVTLSREVSGYGFAMGNFYSLTGLIENIKNGLIIHTADSYYGSSGGPVVMNNGSQKLLVGIIIGTSNYGTNLDNLRKLYNRFVKHKEVKIFSKAVSFSVISEKLFNYALSYSCPITRASLSQRQ